jgi:hypothetical protein
MTTAAATVAVMVVAVVAVSVVTVVVVAVVATTPTTSPAVPMVTVATAVTVMREESKTGGALGAVSTIEIQLLMNAYGDLQQDTAPAKLRKSLLNINKIMQKIENDPIANEYYATGERGTGGGSVDPAVTDDVDPLNFFGE